MLASKKKALILVPMCAALVVALMSLTASPARAGTFITKMYGNRIYKVLIPDGYVVGTPIPLVVMLHGCSQNPDDFATGTEMNNYADQFTFFAVYPDEPSSANSSKCWNWFLPEDQQRDTGEPGIIAGIVSQVKADYTIDNSRVYVAGMSAGAAMSVVVAALYPDVFAAMGEHSGLEFKAANDLPSALIAQQQGGPDPNGQGTVAYNAMGQYRRVMPVIIFHGQLDATVQVVNAAQVTTQWAQTDDLASDGSDNNNIDDIPEQTIPGSVPLGHTYTHYIYNDSTTGQTVIEKYIVDGMSHAWSGGNVAGTYTDGLGPKASLIMWQFFAAHPMVGGPTATPPIVASATRTTVSSATRTATSPAISSATRTPTAPVGASATRTPTIPAAASATGTVTPPVAPSATPGASCTIQFSDVQPGSPFYSFVQCLACRGIIGGYNDGTFRPGNNVTRGQLSKIVANSAGFAEPVEAQTFEDVPPSNDFYTYIGRMASRGIVGGYPCGSPGEPCNPPGSRPYFRPNSSATRGQIAKVASQARGFSDPPGAQIFEDMPPGSTFYAEVQRLATRGYISGYPCGGPGEPCHSGDRPYFRPNSTATRGQTAKIVSNTFFPECQPAAR